MYSKILVAVDRSPIAENIVETAICLAESLNSELYFLHVLSQEVVESPINYTPYSFTYDTELMEELQHQWEKYRQESVELLEYWANQAKEKGIKVDSSQVYGMPGVIICQQAKKWEADLIIVGRRGHSTVSEILLGSVSSYVIHRCHCAVHLVQF